MAARDRAVDERDLDLRLFAADLVDEALVFIAPKLLGDDEAVPVARAGELERLSDARLFKVNRVKQLGDDVMLRYFRRRDAASAAPREISASEEPQKRGGRKA